MNRLESLNINDRPVTMALLHYDDHYYDAALRKYNLKEALYLYFKRSGLKTIVFFSIENGIHSFEKKMLETFLKTKNDTSDTNQSNQQNHQPRIGRHGGSGLFEIKPQVSANQNHSVLTEQCQNIWRDRRPNLTRDAQVAQMCYSLIHRTNCAIIIEPSKSQAEFTQNPPQKHLIDRLTGTLADDMVKQNNNHFIVLGNTHISKGKAIPESINPFGGRTNSDFWRTPYFQQQFLDDEKDEKGNTMYSLSGVDKSDGAVYVLPEPTENDIKNAFQYWRIVNSRSWKIEWSEVKDIVSQLSIKRGEKDKLMSHSLDQWEKFFKATDIISINAFEPFGVHKVDDSKVIKFDKEKLINDLKAVKAQHDNMGVIVNTLSTWIRRKNKKKPIVFMFAGTSGTGKTFTAETIHKNLAGLGYGYVDLHMNEYSNSGDTWKFLGSATGHVGSENDAPIFAAKKKSDQLVILFDEIEKAHPSLFTTIMTLMDKGQLADGRGVNYDFRQSIIIFTTNRAMEQLLETKNTLKATGVGVDSNKFQAVTKKILKDSNVPREICGRIDWLLVYNTLSASDIVQIAVEQIREMALEYRLNINNISKTYLKSLAEQCAGSDEGARPVRTQTSQLESMFQDASESGRFSAEKLYDINDDLVIVESASTELVEGIILATDTIHPV